MVNRFTIGGETYTAKPFDFEILCELEGTGVNVQEIDKMSFSLIRGYFAVCAGIDKSEAASIIQNHIVSGGSIEDISVAMGKEMDKSDFFRALANRRKQGTNENLSESETESAEKAKRGRKPSEE